MKKYLLHFLTLAVAPLNFLSACTTSTSISLPEDVHLSIQGPRKIQSNSSATYTVQSSLKTNENYIWKIHKESVASISAVEGNTCTISAHETGRTYITVSVKGTDNYCTYEIEVTYPVPTSITINGETDLFIDTDSQPYSVTYEPQESQIGVNWSIIEGDTLALINSDGVVTPLLEGKIKIKATSKFDSKVYGVFEIDIHPPKPETLLIVGPNVISTASGATQYTVNFSPEESFDDILWSLAEGEEKYATISSDGILTPIAIGTIHINAQAKFKPEVTNTLEVKIVDQIYNIGFNQTVGTGYTYKCPTFATPSEDLIIPFTSNVYDEGGLKIPTHKQLKASDLQIRCSHDGIIDKITNYSIADNILIVPKDEIKGDITITILGAEISDSITWEILSSISQNDIDQKAQSCMELFQVGDYKTTRRNNVIYGYARIIDFFHDFYYDDEGNEQRIPFTFLTIDDGGDYTYCRNRANIDDAAKWHEDNPAYPGLRYQTMQYVIGDNRFDTLNYIRNPIKYVQQVGKGSEDVKDLEGDVAQDNGLYYFPLDFKELNGGKAHGDDPDPFNAFSEEEMMQVKAWKSEPYSYFMPDKYIADLSILERRIFQTVHHPHSEESEHYHKCAWVRNGSSWLSFCWIDLDTGKIIPEYIGSGSLWVLCYATIFLAFCI